MMGKYLHNITMHKQHIAGTYRLWVEDNYFYKDDVDKMLDGMTSIYTVYLKIDKNGKISIA